MLKEKNDEISKMVIGNSSKYYESSINKAHDYLEIYYSSEQGKEI